MIRLAEIYRPSNIAVYYVYTLVMMLFYFMNVNGDNFYSIKFVNPASLTIVTSILWNSSKSKYMKRGQRL